MFSYNSTFTSYNLKYKHVYIQHKDIHADLYLHICILTLSHKIVTSIETFDA